LSRTVSLLARFPRLALSLILVLTVVAGAGIGFLRFDSSLTSLIDPSNPARQFQERAAQTFGDQEVGVVALVVDDVYRPEVLEALRELTSALGAIHGISRALSLANVTDATADVFDPPPLIPPGPIRAGAMPALKARVAANALFVPHLVAANGGAAAINLFFDTKSLGPDDESRIDASIEKLLGDYHGPGTLYYTGVSHIRVRAVSFMRADLTKFLPLSLVCMTLVLWVSFRSFRAILLPLGSQALGVGLLLGTMGWLDVPITLPTLVLPSLLLVIGASYAVHVTTALLEVSVHRELRLEEAFSRVLKRVGVPVAVSGLTTAVGFGSLAVHPIPAIAGLGMFAVIGVVIVTLGCLFALPLAFLSMPGRSVGGSPARGTAGDGPTLLDRVLTSIGAPTIDHRRGVFVASLVVLVVSVLGAARIRVDTDFLHAFRESSEVRVAAREVAERLVGPNPISVVIEGPEAGYFKSIGPLRRVKEFEKFLKELAHVGATISLVDYLDELDLGLRSSSGGLTVDDQGRVVEAPPPPSFWDAPREQLPAVLQFVSLSPSTFAGLVDPDFRSLNLTIRTDVSGSRETADLVHQIEVYARTMFPAGVRVTPTGPLVVLSEVADRLITGQVESVALAFAVIFVVLSLMFLSTKVGLAAMIPNLLPVVVFFGVMGWSGIELNLATSIVAAIALGMAVDATIHYMARLNNAVKETGSRREALLSTLQAVGRPVVATTLTLAVGFGIMMLSGFAVIANFGMLSAVTMLVALVTNLTLLPAILATVPVISVWDLVTQRLGPRPHKTIPLFDGLGRLAVRLIVLLGKLERFPAGAALVRRGDPGNEMYLLLNGEAEVRVPAGASTRAAARLERGDVFGEMGLLRRTVRAADVEALSDVEVLVIDEGFLRRLQRRYPRFASRFFFNIAKILSDRLEEANRRASKAD